MESDILPSYGCEKVVRNAETRVVARGLAVASGTFTAICRNAKVGDVVVDTILNDRSPMPQTHAASVPRERLHLAVLVARSRVMG